MPEVLEYSTDVIAELGYGPMPGRQQRRFGLEVEVSDWSEEDQMEANRRWYRAAVRSLSHPALASYSNAYCIPCHDGSLDGDDTAELKTPPFTKSEHWLFHASYSSEPPPETLHPQEQREFLKGVSAQWFPNSRSWANCSCGMHITVELSTAAKWTWRKLLIWVNEGGSELRQKVLFLRRPNSYCDLKPCNLLTFSHGNPDKYELLHLKNGYLAEFRGFRSSTNPMTIMRNIDVVDALLDWMPHVPTYDVGTVGLRHFGAWLRTQPGKYPYLRDWIVHRAASSPLTQGFNA